MFHRLYRLPKIALQTPATGKFTKDDGQALRAAVVRLSAVLKKKASLCWIRGLCMNLRRNDSTDNVATQNDPDDDAV